MMEQLVTNFAYPILGVLVFGIGFKYVISGQNKKKELEQKKYWELEQKANYSRKKELPDTLFLKVDFNRLPQTELASYIRLQDFQNKLMANLGEFSNVELKLSYGVSQLDQLANYERNCFEFMNTAYDYAYELYELMELELARIVLSYIIELGCDLSKAYLLLGKIYKKQQSITQLNQLVQLAQVHMKHSPFLQKVTEELKTEL